MTRNITENLLINNVLYKQVFQKEDVAENTTQQEKASDLSQMQKRYDIIEYQDVVFQIKRAFDLQIIFF